MLTSVLLALLGMLCVLVQSPQSAPSAAVATPTENSCPPGQFFNADHSVCDHCAVLPDKPSEQEQLHYQRQCLRHPVCCPASVPGKSPPHANATSPTSPSPPGQEPPRGGLATSSLTATVSPPAGCSGLPTGATVVAIAVLALLVIALAGAVVLLMMRLRKIHSQKAAGVQSRRVAAGSGGEELPLQQDVDAAAATPGRNPGPTVTSNPTRGDDRRTYYATAGQG